MSQRASQPFKGGVGVPPAKALLLLNGCLCLISLFDYVVE